MKILTISTKNILRAGLIATLLMLSPLSSALAESITADNAPIAYDSMYQYYALESRVSRNEIDDEAENIIDNVALSNDSILIQEDLDQKKEFDHLVEKKNASQTAIVKAMNDIENGAKIKGFILGRSLGELRFQLVQIKDSEESLQRLMNKVSSDDLGILIKNEIDSVSPIEARAEKVLLKEQGRFSLLGWFVGML
jgi:hypothetical protein